MGIQQPNILKLISSDAIDINLEIKSVACNQSELVKRKLTIKLLNCAPLRITSALLVLQLLGAQMCTFAHYVPLTLMINIFHYCWDPYCSTPFPLD